MPEMLLKLSQLAIFPGKCLALSCCSISPPSFHRKLKLAFGCWKSVCCSFRLLKERLPISVLKRIVSVNEFLPLSLKVKGSKRYNELKRFCGQISKWKSFIKFTGLNNVAVYQNGQIWGMVEPADIYREETDTEQPRQSSTNVSQEFSHLISFNYSSCYHMFAVQHGYKVVAFSMA